MFHSVKAEKERAMRRRRRLQLAAALSRYLLEALAALVLVSWFSARLPAAVALCGELRRLPSLLLRPVCAFVAGNAIILALVAKAGFPHRAAAKEMPEGGFHVRRSKSAKVPPVAVKDGVEKALRRSQTTRVRRRREVAWWAVQQAEESSAEDDELFRQKIEEFIAKKKTEFVEREEGFLQLAGFDSGGAAVLPGDDRRCDQQKRIES